MATLEAEDFDFLPQPAQTAIGQNVQRMTRAEEAGDGEAVVGAAKELVESVAKAIMDALGVGYPSSPSLADLGSRALDALRLHPSGLQGRPALRNISGAFITTFHALAELRNTDGTGHGRGHPSDLDPAHVTLAAEAATAWCRWVLSAARRVFGAREAIDEAVEAISGGRAFRRGELPDLLTDVQISDLPHEDQRRLGLAVGRRWNIGQTFNARDDVIEPMANGLATYPSGFAVGLIDGLVLDYSGYVQTSGDAIGLLLRIVSRLPEERRAQTVSDLASLIETAEASYAFEGAARATARDAIRGTIPTDGGPLADALHRLAERFDRYVAESSSGGLGLF